MFVADENAMPGECPPVAGNGTSVPPETTSASATFASCMHVVMTLAAVVIMLIELEYM